MKFKIEQLAFAVDSHTMTDAMRFLKACGLTEWVTDTVAATGTVHGEASRNKAVLSFNYDSFDGKELEILRYTEGTNWLARDCEFPVVSHIGMHIEEEDLAHWRGIMADFSVKLAQEVWTDSHTNPRIARCRRYHYVIYSTRHLIGVDMKFIVRRIIDQKVEDNLAAGRIWNAS